MDPGVATIGAVVLTILAAGAGWIVRTVYDRRQHRPKLRARLLVRRGRQDGIDNLPLMIFDIINFGQVATVITQLDVFVGRGAIQMRDVRGEHDLPHNLQPGETLVFQADLRRLTSTLVTQGASPQKRLRARFWDAAKRKYWSKWSPRTVGEYQSNP